MKTLKELEKEDSEYGYVHIPSLRKEAIRLIKEFDEKPYDKSTFGKLGWGAVKASGAIEFMKIFFNITEDDLK